MLETTSAIGAADLHLFGEGRHERLWELLGAHVYTESEPPQTRYSVWAPHARSVQVIGSFNNWDGTGNTMRLLGASGIWELTVPGNHTDSLYRFRILTASGNWIQKADPMARRAELPPSTSSIVTPPSRYVWSDGEWMRSRSARPGRPAPQSVYEVHLASWTAGHSYRSVAAPLIAHLRETGFTHVEFMPLAEHPYGPSWGYQVSGYYAPTSRFGAPDDLRYLINELHNAGFGVILDWVPGHFPKDAFALGRFDGQPLYEHSDPMRGEHPDWGTYIFNYGDSQVRNFLVANALFWLESFHVDALRVDAVASMLYLDYSRPVGAWQPNKYGGNHNLEAIAFLQEVTATAHRLHSGVQIIAEESTSFPGVTAPTNEPGLGFARKWNMGWMNDTLRYMRIDPIRRRNQHSLLTHSLSYAYAEKYILPLSHDEVVHGKGSLLQQMPGDRAQQLANLRVYYAFMWAYPGAKLLFMGQEFAQEHEWDSAHELPWHTAQQPGHSHMIHLIAAMNRLYKNVPALNELDDDPSGFAWIDEHDRDNNYLSFSRHAPSGETLRAAFNFSGRAITLDQHAAGAIAGQVILNTNEPRFGGTKSGPAQPGDVIDKRETVIPPLTAIWTVRG